MTKPKYTNTIGGYDLGKRNEKDPWWQHPKFPLIPQTDFCKGDEQNTSRWSLSWLWFRVWTLDCFSLEFSVELDYTGFNVKFIFGWLRVVIRIIPVSWSFDFLMRKPKNKTKML